MPLPRQCLGVKRKEGELPRRVRKDFAALGRQLDGIGILPCRCDLCDAIQSPFEEHRLDPFHPDEQCRVKAEGREQGEKRPTFREITSHVQNVEGDEHHGAEHAQAMKPIPDLVPQV